MKLNLLILLCSVFTLNTLIAQQFGNTVFNPEEDSTATISKADSVKAIDLVDSLVRWVKIKDSEKKRDNRKIRFTLFPTTSSSGKTSFTSFNASFLLDGDATTTNRSTVDFFPYIGFGGQYGFDVQSFIWLSQNSWNSIGEYFY